jgi:hypothetical protein
MEQVEVEAQVLLVEQLRELAPVEMVAQELRLL